MDSSFFWINDAGDSSFAARSVSVMAAGTAAAIALLFVSGCETGGSQQQTLHPAAAAAARPPLSTSASPESSDATPENSDEGLRPPPISHLASMPSFSAAALDGGKLSSKSLKGKVVLINFWATWCAPCRQEIPDLQSLFRQFGSQGFIVVGMTVTSPTAEVQRLRKARHLTYPMIAADGETMKAFQVEDASMPESFLVDRVGHVIKIAAGLPSPSSAKFWEPLIKKALAAPRP